MKNYETTLLTLVNHAIEMHPEILDFILKKNNLDDFIIFKEWQSRGFCMPCPTIVKHLVLERNSVKNATWVETGTYLGDTTFFLSKISNMVFSIEPEEKLFNNASNRFKESTNVNLINSTSENAFPSLLSTLKGDVNFWLDGHYSAGITFQGENDTPIRQELSCIENNLTNFNNICICIDDVRCFDPSQSEYLTYPDINFLVNFAQKNKLKWHIEHDIFIAKNFN